MPKDYTEQTIKDFYHDDYSDSAGFHKILFNSSRYLQARELTQLQTILQNQVTKFADNVFQDGAATSGSGQGVQRLEYVLVNKIDLGNGSGQRYVGKTLKGPPETGVHDGLKFTVSFVVEPIGDESFATLYGGYSSANQSGSSNDVQSTILKFAEEDKLEHDVLTDPLPDLYVAIRDGAPLSTGTGLLYGIQGTSFYTQGHFVHAKKQKIVISPYEVDVDVDVGFRVIQDIITIEDDDSLYDNQGAVPNLASPGADRYRIRLELTTKGAVANILDFVSYAKIKGGYVAKVKEANTNYNEIEKRMAVRQFDTNGDFIVNPFGLSYQAGNTEETITMTVEGLSSAGKATAFVDGYRLMQEYDSDYTINKPISTVLFSSTSSTVGYKNYVQVKNTNTANLGLGNWSDTGDITTQRRFSLLNGTSTSATKIGTARIKSVTRNAVTADDNGVHLYLYDVEMNANKNFRDVEGICSDAAAPTLYGANPIIPLQQTGSGTGATAQNVAILPKINNSLFEIPGGRPKTVSDVQFQSQRQFDVGSGSGAISISSGTNNTFENKGEWIFINRTDNKQETGIGVAFTSGGTNGGGADITGLTAGKDYTIFAYAKDNASVPKVKKLKVTGYETWTASNGTADFKLAGKYDGVRLISARTATGATGGTDLSDLVEFDGGQRDNFYSPIVIKRGGVKSSITAIHVKYEFFEWQGGGDYFSVSSYDLLDADAGSYKRFAYSNIPIYTSNRDGRSYDLRNYFDFRSKLDPSAATMLADDRFFLPKDGGQIVYDVEFYNQRIDTISLGYNSTTFDAEIRIHEGIEELDPKPTKPRKREMILFNVTYGGNTISTLDLDVKTHSYKRFTMRDIEHLENRVNTLEETVSLSFLEQGAENLVEMDVNGAIRSKTGFFVDNFTNGFAFTASPTGPNWVEDFASIGQTLLQTGENDYSIEPKNARQVISMSFDSGGTVNVGGYEKGTQSVYDALGNAGNNNFKHMGDTIYLDYVETLDESLVNESISWISDSADYEENGYYNVNPFAVFTGEGSLSLSPDQDLWFDNIRLPTVNITRVITNVTQLLPVDTSTVDNGDLFALHIGAFMRNERDAQISGTWKVGQRNTIRTRNILVSGGTTTTLNSTKEDKLVMSYPFARSRPIYCQAKGLRPDTRYWPYFEGVEVSQWCNSLEKGQYKTHIQDGDHLKTYSPVNVNVTQNPDGTSPLFSNRNGELYYSFFLPNSAPIASNNGKKFSTFAEWEGWGEEQKRLAAATLSSIKDPAVYDAIGWKFKTGMMEMKLLDVSPINGQGADESQALSRASSIYRCEGELRVRQTTNHYTRNTTMVTQQVTSGSSGPVLYKYDPLAQGFEIDARRGVPGAFITKVDVFLRKAPQTSENGGDQLAIPIQLQIREMEAGFPKAHPITEQFRIYRTADSCYEIIDNIDNLENLDGGDPVNPTANSVLGNPVTFQFEEPVYIEGGTEYAIVLLSECDNYEAFISTTHSLVLGKTTHRINKQPSSGSLFLSQNGSTWTPKQDQNMAYRVHTAKFKSEGIVNFKNSEFPKFVHNQELLSLDSVDAERFRVNQFAHGLGVGDPVALTGLVAAELYYGVSGSHLMNTANVVAQADAGGYFVNLPSGQAFTNTGPVNFGKNANGKAECQSVQGFNFDRALMDFVSIDFQGTSIDYKGNFITGNTLSEFGKSGDQDQRFQRTDGDTINLSNIVPIQFDKPKMLADFSLETSENIGRSIVISANMKNTITSTFGNATDEQISAGYVSDVTPIIDLQKCNFSMQNFQIDNQVIADVFPGSTSTQNRPYFWVSETDPSRGSSPSKHITKPIILETPSKGLRVFIEANKPPATSFDLYYRTVSGDDNIFDVNWTLIEPIDPPPDSPFNFATYNALDLVYSEYSYLIGGKEGFTDFDFLSFQLKIVMKSTNSCQIPVIDSIRAIALAT
jgi:hypothetical protein